VTEAGWLRENAIPIKCLEAGQGGTGDDLAALGRMLAGVKVVGLGEVTHGTKEFYRYRHRLLRHLVTEMGFTILAIEGGHSSAQAVDDYLLNGTGDRAAALAAFGHALWDVEEFGEAVDWLRAHNESVPAAEKVRFHGLSMWNTRMGRARVLAYLRTVAPERLPPVDAAFRAVAWGERRGMLLAHRRLGVESFLRIRELADFLSAHRAELVERTCPDEYEDVVRHVAVIRQWIACNLSDELTGELAGEYPAPVPAVRGLNIFARSLYMGQNLLDLLARAGPRARAVIWAHTLHVGVGFHDEIHGKAPNMGGLLRDRLGDQYYAVAMETEHGTYLSREFLPDRTLGDLRIAVIPPAPAGSLAWRLATAGGERFLLDLRRAAHNGTTGHNDDWLDEPTVMHCAGWAHSDPPLSTTMRLGETYDGIVFIRETSATTPTKHARRAVARRAGY
jgi:erythromycin esterase